MIAILHVRIASFRDVPEPPGFASSKCSLRFITRLPLPQPYLALQCPQLGSFRIRVKLVARNWPAKKPVLPNHLADPRNRCPEKDPPLMASKPRYFKPHSRTARASSTAYLSGRTGRALRTASGVRTALYLRVLTRTRSRTWSTTGFAAMPRALVSKWSGTTATSPS